LNNLQQQILTVSIFSSSSGNTCRAAQPTNATPRWSYRNSHPGRFATNHKISPLPQEDNKKATR